jgi:hypothetical protein
MNYENKKIKTIGIIGVGSLGGFTANAISYLDEVKKLYLIDHDKVLKKNLQNSIFREKDVDRLKVDVIEELIECRGKEIIKFPRRFIEINKSDQNKIKENECNLLDEITFNTEKNIENENLLNECDLILDCRDFTYDRYSSKICRFYISSRYLIIDCRNNIKYSKKIQGKYLTNISKNDIGTASNIISSLVENRMIFQMIENQSIKEFNLDYLKRKDLNYCDLNCIIKNIKLINLNKFKNEINNLKINDEIMISIGSKDYPIFIKKIKIIENFKIDQIIFELLEENKLNNLFNTYVVSFLKINNEYFLELLPETGAA